jgi:DNA-directed RNA polymerase subunit RPC12/RpoP
MTLINCKECKKKISNQAKTCTHCGAANIVKLRQDTIAGVITMLIIASLSWYYLFKPSPKIEPTEAELKQKATENAYYKAKAEEKRKISLALEPARKKMVARFISNKEPTAKDAMWTADDIFKVAVFDNGSSQNGYAEYVCLTLYENGFKDYPVWVQIIDIAKIMQEKRFVKLGEAHCDIHD